MLIYPYYDDLYDKDEKSATEMFRLLAKKIDYGRRIIDYMGGIRHAGIYAKDLEAMVSFYKEIFDLKVVVHQKESGAHTDRVFNDNNVNVEVYKLEFNDGSIIELLHHCRTNDTVNWDEKIYQCGKMHVAITVDSANEIYYKLKQKNCILLSEPSDSPYGNARVFFARDIEGNYLELVEEL